MGSVPTAFLIWLASVVLGWRKGRVRSRPRLREAPPVPPPLPSNRRVTTVALWGSAAVLLIAATIYFGHDYRLDRERRAAAIALTSGNPDRAPQLIALYGCGGCHMIPGVPGARGLVGPPLAQFGQRVYIAGVLTNTPDHLLQWIVNPPAVDPQTAMPATGITREQARDVAAYLYAAP